MAFCAPEVLNALKVFLDPTCLSTVVDYSGQAVFEAGVLLWEMATGQHPLDSYPTAQQQPGSAGKIVYDDGDVCEVDDELREALLSSGYPVSEFVALIKSMVGIDASSRPSLSAAKGRFDALFSVAAGDVIAYDGGSAASTSASSSPAEIQSLQTELTGLVESIQAVSAAKEAIAAQLVCVALWALAD